MKKRINSIILMFIMIAIHLNIQWNYLKVFIKIVTLSYLRMIMILFIIEKESNKNG